MPVASLSLKSPSPETRNRRKEFNLLFPEENKTSSSRYEFSYLKKCMRRADQLSRKRMEVQQKSILRGYLENSQFAQKLLTIPILKSALETADGAYVKVKDSNTFVGKSLELTVNISSAVVDKLAPIAEKGLNVAYPVTTKLDELALKGLDGLIARVPIINEPTQEIAQQTRTVIDKQVAVISGYTETALKTWPVQSALDVYEAILNTACSTLDYVVPPSKEESEQGPTSTKEPLGEDEKHKRVVLLAQRTYIMFSTAFRRIFGKCQTQVENAVSATDLVVKQIQTAVGDATHSTSEADNVSNTEDVSSKQTYKKKNKNKNGQD